MKLRQRNCRSDIYSWLEKWNENRNFNTSINGIWQVRDTIDNGYVGYFVEEGLLGGIACFSLFYSLLKSSWKKATFKNSRNMNNSFFLCFVSYVAVMLSVADVSQLLWVIIALYITYNAKAQAIASE